MSQSIPISDLESSPAAKFNEFGDTYVGVVTWIKEQQQTDPKTGQVKQFPSGDPMTLWVIGIDPDDGGEQVTLWAKAGRFTAVKGSGKAMLPAIVDAIKAAGAKSFDVGARLAVRYSGESEAVRGMNPAKLFEAQYQPPKPEATSVPVDLFSNQQQ
jgi:hypothetical protein